jgi:signal transduction histidine kinase/DNA-binding response OmpR family regulator
LSRTAFDLVLLDLEHRPDQEDLCRWLTTHPGQASRFVLLVARADQIQGTEPILPAGVDDLLLKPYNPAAVRIRIDASARQVQQRREWERQQQEATTRAHQQVAIAALGQCALSHDVPTVIEVAGRFIVDTLEVGIWVALEVSEDGQSLTVVDGFGWPEGHLSQRLIRPANKSLIGGLLNGDEDVIVEDLAHDDRFGAPDHLLEHGIVSAICVAIKGKTSEVFGILAACSQTRRRFVDADMRFLQGVANVLAAAIEQKRNEAEIQKHQSQLQHLQRLESVGQLAAGLAHDYNNVLSVIHGHVTLALGDSKLPPKLASSLTVVLEAIERAASLTRQMLSFSRKQTLSPEPLDLNAVMTSMARLLDRVLGQQVRVELEPATELPAVNADAGMLDQVLMNLAVNARDAMPKGGLLRIGTGVVKLGGDAVKPHPEARPGEFVCLTVTDTGCGMDEATLKRIYDPFFTTKEPGKGTGLGLSTVYGIVKQHQGWIEVESAVGHGTSFRIYLPSTSQPLAKKPAPIAPSGVEHGHGTIFLVEDEPTLRELARMLLEDLGYEVIEAASGREALQVWAAYKEQVHVLLTDLVMPDGLTGFELAETLQRDCPDLKVVFTSGYSADEVRKQLPADCGFNFLQKPYRKETLGQALRQCQVP